jgi:UDP-glucose 4-epimerase
MRTLVTGAAGFVGYAVAALLAERGHEVIGLTRSTSSALPDGVLRMVRDIRDSVAVADAIAPVEAVFHLAGLATVRESRSDPLAYWSTNAAGTLNVLNGMATAGVTRLVAASTCAVYGEPVAQPIDEQAVTAPTSPYGSSKLAADLAVADFAATGRIGALSLRAFNISGAAYGHADRELTRLIPKLLSVQRGEAPEINVNGDGSAIRDFVHVLDMAEAFVRALDACVPGVWRAYNVGSGQRTTVREVIGTVEAITGRPVPKRHLPPAPEPPVLLADSSLIRAELGWEPKKSTLPEIVSDAWNALTCE